MQQGDAETALEALKRIIAIEPTDLGARLDLALLCYHLKQTACARQQLETLQWLIGGSPPPLAAQQAILWLEAQLKKQSQAPAALASGLWFVEVGHDTNANLGADNRDVRLNLWGELPLTLELADASMQTRDQYVEVGAVALWSVNQTIPEAVRFALADHAQWLAGVSHRAYRSLEGYEQSSLYGGVQWYKAETQQRISLMANQQWLGLEPYRFYVLAEAEQPLPGAEHWLISARYEWIKEQVIRLPSSQRLRLGISYRRAKAEVNLEAAWHHRPDRMAGDTLEAVLEGKYHHTLAPGVRLSTYAQLNYTEDTAPYSAQFFGDVQRTETTWQLGAKLSRRWAGGTLDWDTGYEQTRSTIPFNQRNRLVTRLQYRAHW